MDIIQTIVQHSTVVCLMDVADIATLRCVSKSVLEVVNVYCNEDNEFIQKCTLTSLGVSKLKTVTAIDTKLLVKHCLTIRRMYGQKDLEDKFHVTLKEFTSNGVKKLWKVSNFKNLSKDEQICCIDLMLSFIVAFDYKHHLQHNVIVVYILMCFIFKFINNNTSSTLRDTNMSVLAYNNLRRVMCSRCNHITNTLHETVTAYPYLFVNRVIRKCKDVKRLITNLAVE
jgi:hypothetical protein